MLRQRSSSFRPKTFLNDGATYPRLVGNFVHHVWTILVVYGRPSGGSCMHLRTVFVAVLFCLQIVFFFGLRRVLISPEENEEIYEKKKVVHPLS